MHPWLAKYNNLHLLKELYRQIVIPNKVLEEAVTAGRLNDYPDADIIDSAMTTNDILTNAGRWFMARPIYRSGI